jgi:hypothetical protein
MPTPSRRCIFLYHPLSLVLAYCIIDAHVLFSNAQANVARSLMTQATSFCAVIVALILFVGAFDSRSRRGSEC